MVSSPFIIVGGSLSHVPFILAARSLGLWTVVFDRDPSSPGAAAGDAFYPISTHDLEGIAEKCSRLNRLAPLAGIITYSSFTMPLKAVAHVAEIFGLPSYSPQAVENVTSKAQMKRRFYEEGVPTPECRVASEWSEAEGLLAELTTPVIVKPASGSVGSEGVSVPSEERELREAYDAASKASEDSSVVLEKFYDGHEFSVDGIVSRNRTIVLGVSEKFNLGPARNFIMSGFATGRNAEPNANGARGQIAEVVSHAVEALGINNSFFSADVLLTKQGHMVLEVGVLLDAKIDRLLHFCGVDVYEMICRVACGQGIEREEREWSRGYALKFIFADHPGALSISSRVGQGDIHRGSARWLVEWERQSGDIVQPPHSIADVVGWVLAEGSDRATAYALASQVADDYGRTILFQQETEKV